jgi:hypothetical protein
VICYDQAGSMKYLLEESNHIKRSEATHDKKNATSKVEVATASRLSHQLGPALNKVTSQRMRQPYSSYHSDDEMEGRHRFGMCFEPVLEGDEEDESSDSGHSDEGIRHMRGPKACTRMSALRRARNRRRDFSKRSFQSTSSTHSGDTTGRVDSSSTEGFATQESFSDEARTSVGAPLNPFEFEKRAAALMLASLSARSNKSSARSVTSAILQKKGTITPLKGESSSKRTETNKRTESAVEVHRDSKQSHDSSTLSSASSATSTLNEMLLCETETFEDDHDSPSVSSGPTAPRL